MATHVGALGLASAAYALSRRYAAHRAFAFGTGKIHALAGYTSAVALGLVALLMLGEAVSRMIAPAAIDFRSSLPVAVLGLLVNLASLRLLHGHGAEDEHAHDSEDEHAHDSEGEHEHGAHEHEHGGHLHERTHGHDHDHVPERLHGSGAELAAQHTHGQHTHGHGHHDHNHRAAVLHVAADALTSLLAIVALLAGRFGGYMWLDPAMGIVGSLVILKWGAGLCKHAAFELLDVEPSGRLEQSIRGALERIDDVRVSDLHVWPLGGGKRACIVTLISSTPRESLHYRECLRPFGLGHLTVEVLRCHDGFGPGSPSRPVSAPAT